MSNRSPLRMHVFPGVDDMDEAEAGSFTHELDDGLVLPFIPDDPEHDRVIDPED